MNFFSQDSIPQSKDLAEEKELNFQLFFFKALSEKSIGNHLQAIQNLESCNQILPNNIAVYFEFSKNYLSLNNTILAKEYNQRALAKDPNNTWMLKHLVTIFKKENNLTEAIQIQQKLVDINPKERELLVKLFIQNNQIEKATNLLTILAAETILSRQLKRINETLKTYNKKVTAVKKSSTDITGLINQFKTDKSYKILEQILQKSTDNSAILKYSKEGIALFPAQAFVYLMNGKAFNNQKNFKKAITSLQNGIDFVIDDVMESHFYTEMAKAYLGLGDVTNEKKYKEKSEKLKN